MSSPSGSITANLKLPGDQITQKYQNQYTIAHHLTLDDFQREEMRSNQNLILGLRLRVASAHAVCFPQECFSSA